MVGVAVEDCADPSVVVLAVTGDTSEAVAVARNIIIEAVAVLYRTATDSTYHTTTYTVVGNDAGVRHKAVVDESGTLSRSRHRSGDTSGATVVSRCIGKTYYAQVLHRTGHYAKDTDSSTLGVHDLDVGDVEALAVERAGEAHVVHATGVGLIIGRSTADRVEGSDVLHVDVGCQAAINGVLSLIDRGGKPAQLVSVGNVIEAVGIGCHIVCLSLSADTAEAVDIIVFVENTCVLVVVGNRGSLLGRSNTV